MKHIGQGMSALDRGLQVQQNRLASFIEMSTERLDSFRNLSTMQQHAISGLYDELRLVYNTETEDQERIIVTIKRMQRYITHLRHIDQLRQGIQLLLHGFLTPELVPKSALRSNLLSIQSHLKRYFPNFDLVFDRASHFYALHDFLFARHGKRLLIQVQIPITTFQHEFTVYKVTSFHVPVTGRISHSTSLSDLPSFFVTSRHNHYYFLWTMMMTLAIPIYYIFWITTLFSDLFKQERRVQVLYLETTYPRSDNYVRSQYMKEHSNHLSIFCQIVEFCLQTFHR